MSGSTNWEQVYKVQSARIEELERENAALLRDKERLVEALDTLTLVIGLTPIAGNKAPLQEAFDLARAAIDAARREGGAT